MAVKKAEKIQLTTIEFKDSDGRKIRLSAERAKELYQELDKMFADKAPVYIPQAPVIIERYPWWEPRTWWKDDVTYPGTSTATWQSGGGTFACSAEGVLAG